MKKERESQKIRALSVYPIVVSMVVGLLTVVLARTAGQNGRLGWRFGPVDCAALWAVSFAVARLGMAGAASWSRRLLLLIGVIGLTCCVTLCARVLQESNFELTDKSYATLSEAKVPADLIAELRSAEGAVADTEQHFVSDLAARFGPDHIAPYREALVQSGWNVHRREALAALIGVCVCFSLTAGASLVTREQRRREN